MLIKVPYREPLWALAEARASAMPVYRGSHRQRAANQVGALGEVVVEDYLRLNGVPFSSNYQTTSDISIFGATVDIKTKDRTVPPEPDYDCSVPLYNHAHQRPDMYIFVSLCRERSDQSLALSRFKAAYILGWASLRRVDAVGRRWRAEETDPANGTTFWTDCLNLRISQLAGMQRIIDRAHERLGLKCCKELT